MNAWGNCKQEPEYQLFIKQCCVCMYYAKVMFTVFLFHSARTGGQSSGVISQSTNRRVGLRCYFIVHEHEVGVRCYLIVHEPEGKGQVLFHSARTAGQGSEQNRIERTMYHVPPWGHIMNSLFHESQTLNLSCTLKHFVSIKRFIRL